MTDFLVGFGAFTILVLAVLTIVTLFRGAYLILTMDFGWSANTAFHTIVAIACFGPLLVVLAGWLGDEL